MPIDTLPDFPFDVFQHQTAASSGSYVRATDAMANRGQVITFYHVNSGQNMAFKAFLTTYTDTFRPEWTSEAVFGRADPIYMYKNTVRSITIAFKVPAATQSEAWRNLQKVQKLTTFLYPNYSGVGGSGRTAPAQTISGAPLVRMGLMNIIRTTKDDTGHLSPTDTGGIVPNTPETGLLGVIQNVTINHNLDNGSSTGGGFEQSQDGSTSTSILPKFIEVNLDFAVIHETHLGWFDDGTFSNNAFPYNTHNRQGGQGLAKKIAEDAAWAADAASFRNQIAAWQAEEVAADNAAADAYLADVAARNGEGELGWRSDPAVATDAADAVVPDEARPVSAQAAANSSAAQNWQLLIGGVTYDFYGTREEMYAYESALRGDSPGENIEFDNNSQSALDRARALGGSD
jgi:hypothetical protein|tara:strand:+ start:8457 stop:9662 length:1206 start_codon:yes stop_codon:yes gene_type:complete